MTKSSVIVKNKILEVHEKMLVEDESEEDANSRCEKEGEESDDSQSLDS